MVVNLYFAMNKSNKYFFHFIAIITIIIWGTTFVSTKVLISYGLSPAEILLYRFILAYIGIWFVCPRKICAKNLKDELLFVASGLCGGSLYFMFENTALKITLASNVSLIICTAPIFTAFLLHLIYKKEKIKPHLIIGSFIALFGVGLVVFNGSFILRINPLGDLLTILAALCWAFYGVILRGLNSQYSTLFITRKVFFYGIVTMIPFIIFDPRLLNFSVLLSNSFVVIANLVFLGIFASLFCYVMWNTAVKELGVVQTSNYIYFIPLVTLVTSSLVIDEHITAIALVGSVFILSGVYVAERGLKVRITNKKTPI